MAEHVIIPSDLDATQQVQQRLMTAVQREGYPETVRFGIRLALEEGLNNAIKHGNRQDPAKTVDVCFDVTADRVEVTITDEGEGFRPEDLPDPRADENLEKPNGRGVMLMRAYMDEVEFNEQGNRVRMVKRRHEPQG